MPLHDFRCPDGHVTEQLVPADTQHIECGCGAEASKVFLVSAKPLWTALAQGENASPEAISRFDKMHRQQAAKEMKSQDEHGDYGPRPGAD